MAYNFRYKPDGEQLKAFLKCNDFFRALRGPVGSGKSVTCCVEIFRRSLQQAPGPDGIRKSRWAVIRNSYPQLRTTTLATWEDWFPEEVFGPVVMHPPPFTHRIRKGDVDLEVLFLALDRPEDVKKLLSLELTGVWINEAREIPKSIVDACTMRVGRYPSMKDGGPSWYGVIADTNAPDDDHWWPIMAGESPIPDHIGREEALMLIKPQGWTFFNQPGGMVERKDQHGETVGWDLNPLRENKANITPDYYPRIIQGKGLDWIRVYVGNQLGNIADGKPVYPNFNRALHVAKESVTPLPGVPLHVGIDFGLTPAAIVTQPCRGRTLVLREYVATDMGVTKFAPYLKRELVKDFPGWPADKILFWGDPAGDQRAQTDENTPFLILRANGIKARPTNTNDPTIRIDAVDGLLTRLVDGLPGLLCDPSVTHIIRGFESGYHRKRLQVAGAERWEDSPNKNKFSHPHDALQYAVIGSGEGRQITMGGGGQGRAVNGRVQHDPFARKPPAPRPVRSRFS